MSRNVLIVTGGEIDPASAKAMIQAEAFDLVLAVDGGLEAVHELSLTPDGIIGDFDTVPEKVLAQYRNAGCRIIPFPPEKDATDTELALLYALDEWKAEKVVILGALGRRFDHALGNLQILLLGLKRQVPCFLADRWNRIFLIDHDHTFRKEEVFGHYISLIPMTEHVNGVTLTGFRYPLTDARLTIGNSLGISNEIIEENAGITLRNGILICVESGDMQEK